MTLPTFPVWNWGQEFETTTREKTERSLRENVLTTRIKDMIVSKDPKIIYCLQVNHLATPNAATNYEKSLKAIDGIVRKRLSKVYRSIDAPWEL